MGVQSVNANHKKVNKNISLGKAKNSIFSQKIDCFWGEEKAEFEKKANKNRYLKIHHINKEKRKKRMKSYTYKMSKKITFKNSDLGYPRQAAQWIFE